MIAVLGIKRVLILTTLFILNAALAAGVYAYLLPQTQTKERELRGVRGNVSTLRADIDRMQVEFEQLEDQKAAFEALAKRGFFKDQSRRQAERVFNDIQKKSGVSAAIASVKSGAIEDNPKTEKAEYKILKSPIEIRLEAFDDINIFHYLFLAENYFPGHLSIESIHLEREADVTGTVLRAIASGKKPPLVSAEAELTWRTMIPKANVINAEDRP